MKERMQNTGANAHGWPQRDRTASEGYVGVQTYMEIIEEKLVEMHFEGQSLMEQIIDLANLRKAYKQVVRNKSKGGVDGMDVKELFSWCQSHIEDLRKSLMDGIFVPNPVRRVEQSWQRNHLIGKTHVVTFRVGFRCFIKDTMIVILLICWWQDPRGPCHY